MGERKYQLIWKVKCCMNCACWIKESNRCRHTYRECFGDDLCETHILHGDYDEDQFIKGVNING
jgi:hypothetical protein